MKRRDPEDRENAKGKGEEKDIVILPPFILATIFKITDKQAVCNLRWKIFPSSQDGRWLTHQRVPAFLANRMWRC